MYICMVHGSDEVVEVALMNRSPIEPFDKTNLIICYRNGSPPIEERLDASPQNRLGCSILHGLFDRAVFWGSSSVLFFVQSGRRPGPMQVYATIHKSNGGLPGRGRVANAHSGVERSSVGKQ